MTADGSTPFAIRSRPRGPYSTTVEACVQTAPIPARTWGTARPTNGTRVVTAAPDCPVTGSIAHSEKVEYCGLPASSIVTPSAACCWANADDATNNKVASVNVCLMSVHPNGFLVLAEFAEVRFELVVLVLHLVQENAFRQVGAPFLVGQLIDEVIDLAVEILEGSLQLLARGDLVVERLQHRQQVAVEDDLRARRGLDASHG